MITIKIVGVGPTSKICPIIIVAIPFISKGVSLCDSCPIALALQEATNDKAWCVRNKWNCYDYDGTYLGSRTNAYNLYGDHIWLPDPQSILSLKA